MKTVALAPSSVPNSGEGVFVIRDVPANRLASLYSMFLYRIPDQAAIYKEKCTYNTSKSDEYRRHCKKYSLGLASYHAVIDVPPEFDVNPLPNHGPKVNHHFRQNNSIYWEIEHPRYATILNGLMHSFSSLPICAIFLGIDKAWYSFRYGSIQSVTPTRDMKAGEELFTHYGYKSGWDFPEDFPWYQEAEKLIQREERLAKEAAEKEKQAKKKTKKQKKKYQKP